MLNSLLNLYIVFFNLSFMQYWFYPILALAFLATFPKIITSLFSWR